MQIRRSAAGMALATIVTPLTLLASPAPAQAAQGVVLPVTSHWQTLADSHHVYISAPGNDAVVATDHDGQVLATISGLDGARGMTLSWDESALYVALPEANAIAEIDTATLTETRRFATGEGTEPENVAMAGGRLWFAYQANVFDAAIGSVAVAAADPVVDLSGAPEWYGKPRLVSSPANPDRLVAAESAGGAGMRVYDVATATPRQTAFSDQVGSIEDIAMTPDGQSVITAFGSNYFHQRWRVSDLTEVARYETGPYPVAAAVAPNGMIAAGIVAGGDWDIYLYQPQAIAPIRKIALSWPYMDLLRRGVAWAPDGNRLFATRFPYSGEVILDIVTDVHLASSDIALQAPAQVEFGKRVTIRGELSSLVAFPAKGKTVDVIRDGVSLGSVDVKSDGTFSFTDSPPLQGWYEYTVRYAGDAGHVAGSATIIVDFVR